MDDKAISANLKVMGVAIKALARFQRVDLPGTSSLKEDLDESQELVDKLLRKLRGLKEGVSKNKHELKDVGGRFSGKTASLAASALDMHRNDNLLMQDTLQK